MAKETVNLGTINLDDLPQRKSVYAIFAQSKDSLEPINCRYVGETDNLEERTKAHLSENEQNECLRKFMQSDKTKLMIYELLPNSDKAERLQKEKEWITAYNPECNK
ncbi:MAG: GIY-YIG nuclease family protein [Melioribacteraceae bacterium]|nr:GIY-YIG nuclease family protein [Melioribacteraceae bacterium]